MMSSPPPPRRVLAIYISRTGLGPVYTFKILWRKQGAIWAAKSIVNIGRNVIARRWTDLSGPPEHLGGNYFLGLGELVGFTCRQLADDLRTQNEVS